MIQQADAGTHAKVHAAKAGLQDELLRWSGMIRALEETDSTDPVAAHNLETLRHMHARVAGELKLVELAESGSDLELALDGEAIANHEAPAAILGRLLTVFQDLLSAVAQVSHGTPSSKGVVPASIVRQHKLLVQPQFVPSSFAIRLRLPKPEDTGDCTSDGSDALEAVLDCLRAEESSYHIAKLLSHSRVKSHYGKLMTLLARENVELKAATRRSPSLLRVTPAAARDRSDWLRSLETRPGAPMECEGMLVGGDTERMQFRLCMDDGAALSGDVAREALSGLMEFKLGERVRLKVQPYETEHEDLDAEPKTTYTALSFAPPK